MDPDAVKSTLAFGNVVAAAALNYQKELLAQNKANASTSANDEVDLDEPLVLSSKPSVSWMIEEKKRDEEEDDYLEGQCRSVRTSANPDSDSD